MSGFKAFTSKNKPVVHHHPEDSVWTDGVRGIKSAVALMKELRSRINNSHSIASLTPDEEDRATVLFQRIAEVYKNYILPGVVNKIGVTKSIHKPILFYIRYSDDHLRKDDVVSYVQGIMSYVEHQANEEIKSVKETEAVRNREKKKSEIMRFFRANKHQIVHLMLIYSDLRELRELFTHKLDVMKDVTDKQPNWNRLLKEDMNYIIHDFLSYCKDFLHLDKLPKVNIKYDSQESERHKTFGHFMPSSKEVTVYADGRHIVDVLRTLAHELVHWEQSQHESELDGTTGSHHENDANARAGVILRNYQTMNSELFSTKLDDRKQDIIVESARFTKYRNSQGDFLVHHQPVASTLRAVVDRAEPWKDNSDGGSEYKQIRAISDPEGKIHAWDGYKAIHHHVAHAQGHQEYSTHQLDINTTKKTFATHSMAGGSHKYYPETPDIEYHQHKENGQKFHELAKKALEPHGYKHVDTISEEDMRSLDSDYSIPRREMPQIAAADHKDYLYHLKQHGVLTTHETVPAHTLNPTQKNFDADKVKQMSLKTAADPKKPILITRDNDILDGHHRWKKLLDYNQNSNIRAIRLNTNTAHAIEVSKKFPKVFYKQ